jgi:hypothetical protein
MTFAARETSLSTMKLFVEYDGEVEGPDLVAQAAIGHSWGRLHRIEVIEYLLDLGAPIDTMSASTWMEPSSFNTGFTRDREMLMNSGGQTALNSQKHKRIATMSQSPRQCTCVVHVPDTCSIPLACEIHYLIIRNNLTQ